MGNWRVKPQSVGCESESLRGLRSRRFLVATPRGLVHGSLSGIARSTASTILCTCGIVYGPAIMRHCTRTPHRQLRAYSFRCYCIISNHIQRLETLGQSPFSGEMLCLIRGVPQWKVRTTDGEQLRFSSGSPHVEHTGKSKRLSPDTMDTLPAAAVQLLPRAIVCLFDEPFCGRGVCCFHRLLQQKQHARAAMMA
jgi:hypothetical protein